MTTPQPPDAWKEVRKIHRDYKMFYQGGGRVLLLLLVVLVVKALFDNDGDFLKNLSMEVLGILATVLLLDWFAERRESRRKLDELRERLLMEVASQSHETAMRAVSEIRHRGWLTGDDGLLQGARLHGAQLRETDLRVANLQAAALSGAQLQNANLGDAHLQDCDLRGAHLTAANLWSADLRGAMLANVDLREAVLEFADLHGTVLEFADLQGAQLGGAKLGGANLWEANLLNATLENATFDTQTILPDRSNWLPDTDMRRFTDASHAQFWRSGERWSPAYRGK